MPNEGNNSGAMDYSGSELQVMVVEGSMASGFDSPSEKYVTLELGSSRLATRAARGSPLKWKQAFRLRVSAGFDTLTVGIATPNVGLLGTCQVALSALLGAGNAVVKWHDLRDTTGTAVASLCLATKLVRLSALDGASTTTSQRLPLRTSSSGAPSRPSKQSMPTASSPLLSPSNSQLSPSSAPSAASAAPPNLRPSTSSKGKQTGSGGSRPPPSTSGSSKRALVPSKKGEEGKGEREGSRGSTAGQRLLFLSGGLLLVALGSMLFGGQTRKPQVYQVKKGDTVCSIAGCYGLSPDDVVDANATIRDDPDRIFPGDRLFLP